MSYTIGCLLTLGLQVAEPLLWQREDEAGMHVGMDLICPVNREVALHDIQQDLSAIMRSQVSEHKANAGLEQGTPCLNSTKKVYSKLVAEGKCMQARQLQAIATLNAWGAARATKDP